MIHFKQALHRDGCWIFTLDRRVYVKSIGYEVGVVDYKMSCVATKIYIYIVFQTPYI